MSAAKARLAVTVPCLLAAGLPWIIAPRDLSLSPSGGPRPAETRAREDALPLLTLEPATWAPLPTTLCNENGCGVSFLLETPPVDARIVLILSNLAIEPAPAAFMLRAAPDPRPLDPANRPEALERRSLAQTCDNPGQSPPTEPAPANVVPPDETVRRLHWPGIPGRTAPEWIETLQLAVGRRVEVRGPERSPQTLQRAEELRAATEAVLPAVEQLLGPVPDLDGNGGLTLVLAPPLAKVATGGRPLHACVVPHDFEPGRTPPHGNAADLIYINPTENPAAGWKTILAHEAAHAAVCGARAERRLPGLEDWLHEGVAHAVECRAASNENVRERVERYLEETARSPLVLADAMRAGRWRDPGCRGACFLFVDWCLREHGDDWLGRILQTPCGGTDAVAHACRSDFDELYRRWSLHVLAEGGTAWPTRTPAMIPWNIAAPLNLEVAGTSSAFVELECGAGPHDRMWQVEIACGGARRRLQATAVRVFRKKTEAGSERTTP